MKDAMEEVVEEGRKGPVHMRMLATLVAERPAEVGAAVQALGFVGEPVWADFARTWFDRAADDSAGNGVAQAFQIPHRHPLPRY